MKRNLVLILLGLLVSALCAERIYSWSKPEKTGYVLLPLLFSEFKMTKEYQEDFISIQREKEIQMDSINTAIRELEMMVNTATDETVKMNLTDKIRSLGNLKLQMETESYDIDKIYTERIWAQINQYVYDYGKEKGYAFIFGAEKKGNIMYGSDAKDITLEVIEYINQRYEK